MRNSHLDFTSKRSSLFDFSGKKNYPIFNSGLVPDKLNLMGVLKDFSSVQKSRKLDKIFTEKKKKRGNFSIMNYTSTTKQKIESKKKSKN